MAKPLNKPQKDLANLWKHIHDLQIKDGLTNYIATDNGELVIDDGKITSAKLHTIYAQLWYIMNIVQPKDAKGNSPNTGSGDLKASKGGLKDPNLLTGFKQVLQPDPANVKKFEAPSLEADIKTKIDIESSSVGVGKIGGYESLTDSQKRNLKSFMESNITMVKQELMNYNCALLQKNSNYNFRVTNTELQKYLNYVNQLVFASPLYTWVDIPDSLLTNEIYLMYRAWSLANPTSTRR